MLKITAALDSAVESSSNDKCVEDKYASATVICVKGQYKGQGHCLVHLAPCIHASPSLYQEMADCLMFAYGQFFTGS